MINHNGNTKYKGIKDIRYLFNEGEDEDEYEDIRYLFNEYEDVDEDKITYKESPFKSIIVDIRNKLSNNGDKLIKIGLYYVEEMKNLGSTEIKNIYNEEDIYNGINDIKYLFNGIAFNRIVFNENEDNDIKRNAYYTEKIKKIKTTHK